MGKAIQQANFRLLKGYCLELSIIHYHLMFGNIMKVIQFEEYSL